MKVFRGQAKNLRKNIKQNNVKPLMVVFGVLVIITLISNVLNKHPWVLFKGLMSGRRQGFEGREGGPNEDEEGYDEGNKNRRGFTEGQCGLADDEHEGGEDTDNFKGGRVGAYEGMSSCAKNAASVQGFSGNRKQGFRGNRRQGFKGRGLRRREGSTTATTKVDPPPIDNTTPGSTDNTTKKPKKEDKPENFRGSRFGRRR